LAIATYEWNRPQQLTTVAPPPMDETTAQLRSRTLKLDLFGSVKLEGGNVVVRDTTAARWWTRSLARHLARREYRALVHLGEVAGVPKLLGFDGRILRRSWIDGQPMHLAKPRDAAYYRAAHALLRRLHQCRVAHNDLAKEPNWLVTRDGQPALVDFQLAMVRRRRGPLFRALAYDDIRHLLKHKRTYLPEQLTSRERRILAKRSLVSRVWMATGKRVYWFVTRKLFRWSDREGVGDRKF
jgi:RIO-like serine/threonine protein kinase